MKTWLITGCSSGIGKGIAKAVLESGDQAIVTARNKDKVMDIVEAYPETALAVSLDVCSQDSIKNAVKEAYDKFGTIDVLVNNAGYGYRSAVEEGEIEAVQTLYQTNLFGPYEAVVGKSRPGNFENKHQQAGDPDKAGKVIVDVVHNDDLPEILTLGKAAVTAVKSTLEAKIAELDKWAEVSASCDYEEGK